MNACEAADPSEPSIVTRQGITRSVLGILGVENLGDEPIFR